MFDFGRGSALHPAGELIALPQNRTIAGFTGSYFWLNTSLSPTKNNGVFSLGQTDGHNCYHESLEYT